MKTAIMPAGNAFKHWLNSTMGKNKQFTLLLVFLAIITCRAQDTLTIDYLTRTPLAYNDNGTMKGIEVEIMNEYVSWLADKKNIKLQVKYNSFTNFDEFFLATQKLGANGIGLGGVTINKERTMHADFTAPYLKNVAFCITNGNAVDVKNKTREDVVRGLGNLTALTLQNTILNTYVNDLKKQFIPDLKVQFYPNEAKILEDVSKNVLYFGYVDAIGFWFYLKSNPQKVLKIQKALNQSREEMGFVLPKGSRHKQLFNEFFTGPKGYKSSPAYKALLEKYLGSFMTQNVAVN